MLPQEFAAAATLVARKLWQNCPASETARKLPEISKLYKTVAKFIRMGWWRHSCKNRLEEQRHKFERKQIATKMRKL